MEYVIFALDTQVFARIKDVYGNLKDQMKPDFLCEIRRVPWKPNVWASLSITTTDINYAHILSKVQQKTTVVRCQTCCINLTVGTYTWKYLEEPAACYSICA